MNWLIGYTKWFQGSMSESSKGIVCLSEA